MNHMKTTVQVYSGLLGPEQMLQVTSFILKPNNGTFGITLNGNLL